MKELCTHCGLCCNGALFADVELASQREADGMEALGLLVDETDDDAARPLLVQPCVALKNKRCTVYEFRPQCCRTFECALLQRVKRGLLSITDARKQIAGVMRQIHQGASNRQTLIRAGFLGGDL
jgi:uncharacterized protein